MKRKTSSTSRSSEYSSPSSPGDPTPGHTSPGRSRVLTITRLLQMDLGRNIEYPAQGRVRDFLLDEEYVHDARDEAAIIDWCVEGTAAGLLCHVIAEWHRKELVLRNCEGPHVLESAIPTALKAGATSLSLINCAPAHDDYSDNECDKFVLVLSRAACQCEALALERFSLLSSNDLQLFFEYAADRGSLSRLSLCDVSGMDDLSLEKLAVLLSKSKKLEQLCLGGLGPCGAKVCRELAQAIGTSAVQTLSLQGCDTRFLSDVLMGMSELPEGALSSLAQLRVSYTIPGDADGQATPDGQKQRDGINRQLALLLSRHQGLRCDDPEVQVMPATPQGSAHTTDEQNADCESRVGAFGFDGGAFALTGKPHATPSHGTVVVKPVGAALPGQPAEVTAIAWNPRVLSRPGFLRAIVEGMRWLTGNPAKETAEPWTVMPSAAFQRVVFHLAKDDPLKLRWIPYLDWYHHDLWNRTYQRQREALEAEILEHIAALMSAEETLQLIEYAARLRRQGELPQPRGPLGPVQLPVRRWASTPRARSPRAGSPRPCA